MFYYTFGGVFLKYTGNEKIIQDFKQLLNNNGIKQQFIADKLGISKQALNLLMKKKHITFDDMQKILACIGYDLDYFFVKCECNEKWSAKKADKKYFEKAYTQVKLAMPKEEAAALDKYCKKHNLTKAGFIRDLIKKQISLDNDI